LVSAALHEGSAAVVVCLDQYDSTLASLGYSALDSVLDELHHRLISVMPGLEWSLIESGVFGVAVPVDQVEGAAAMARDLVRQPFSVRARSLRLTGSVGVAAHTDDPLRDAVVAMRSASAKGGNRWVRFEPTAVEHTPEGQAELVAALRSAVQFRQLEVWFQPVVRLSDDRPVSLEALARWRHPQLGDVGPGRFIPLAEQHGEIQAVGAFVIGSAADTVKAIRTTTALAMRQLTVSVNVSMTEVCTDGFAARTLDRLAAIEARADALCFEVTEAALQGQGSVAHQNLVALADAGATIAVDDFGTGTSSLERLVEHRVGRLKIDRRFVAGVAADDRTRRLVAAMLAIASDLRLDSVAEGVEQPEQAAVLRELGCTTAQGYLFAPAVPTTELVSVLADLGR
jgi:EAL domain-containing protein (putative c-di-GMP-specific phosphodiesterase class I)